MVPRPSPFLPWQAMQLDSYTFCPFVMMLLSAAEAAAQRQHKMKAVGSRVVFIGVSLMFETLLLILRSG